MTVLPTRDLFYGGDWRAPVDGGFSESRNPANGEPIARVAEASRRDVDLAVAAAAAGFQQWRDVHPMERARILREMAATVRNNAREFAALDAADCGDEPLLLAESTGAPVYVDTDRVRAGRQAIADGADVLVCDDGLQHYRLQRDVEIVLIDGQRRFGNGLPLPAGPLREPPSRLAEADFVVVKGQGRPGETTMQFVHFRLRRLSNGALFEPATLAGRRVHAVAGIAAPQGFFEQLRRLGMTVIEHPLPDHARLSAEMLDFGDDLPVVMTGKDAVKCRPFAHSRCFALDFDIRLDDAFAARLLEKLGHGQETARHPGLPAVQGPAGV
jgi:tetraacyldisaccharide 4'-kinase